MGQKDGSPEGLWEFLDEAELIADRIIHNRFSRFELALKKCYEAGVEVPTLNKKSGGKEHLNIAALFLKRALTDMRATWVLIKKGYTSQAAATAAALFENALTVSCLANMPQKVKEIKKLGYGAGDIPWNAQLLCQMHVKSRKESPLLKEKPYDPSRYESEWREIYIQYKYLCKIKHPTLRSATHDAFSASTPKMKTYLVMANPDIRDEDLSLKLSIISVALLRCLDAIEAFAVASRYNETEGNCTDFELRMKTARECLDEAVDHVCSQGLPFSIGDEKVMREYEAIKKAASDGEDNEY